MYQSKSEGVFGLQNQSPWQNSVFEGRKEPGKCVCVYTYSGGNSEFNRQGNKSEELFPSNIE